MTRELHLFTPGDDPYYCGASVAGSECCFPSAAKCHGEPAAKTATVDVKTLASDPEARRDAELSAVAAAHKDVLRDEMAEAVELIRQAAAVHETLNANTVRPALEAAGISRSVSGSAWRHAVKLGHVEWVGMEQSTDATTRHRIGVYRSLRFVGTEAVA